MKTLKDLKATVARATHMTLVKSSKLNGYLNIKRRIHHVNTVGFSLILMEGSPISYADWPKASELSFCPHNPAKFTIKHQSVELSYEIHTER